MIFDLARFDLIEHSIISFNHRFVMLDYLTGFVCL